MEPWNTWHPMSRTSRILFAEWENIFEVNQLIVILIISRTLRV